MNLMSPKSHNPEKENNKKVEKKDRRLRIAILGTYPPNTNKVLGGGYTYIRDLVHHLGSYEDLEVHALTVSEEFPRDKIVKKGNVYIHYLSSPRIPRIAAAYTSDFFKLKREVKRIKPDIVHGHDLGINGLVATLMRRRTAVLITVFGVVWVETLTYRGVRRILRMLIDDTTEMHILKNADILTVITPYVRNTIKPIFKGEIHVIPAGIKDKWYDIESKEKRDRLLFVGGIEPRKGLEYLMMAMKYIRAEVPNVTLDVVGRIRKKKYFNELKDILKRDGTTDCVKFLGLMDEGELEREYAECSIFVLPSQEESQGIVLVEAMALGKPCVATNVGGIPDVVPDGEAGFLVEYGDPEALAEKIIALLKDDRLRKGFGERAEEVARGFSSKETARKIYELYKRLHSSQGKIGP